MTEKTYRIRALVRAVATYEVDADSRYLAAMQLLAFSGAPEPKSVEVERVTYLREFEVWEGGVDGGWVKAPATPPLPAERTFVPNDPQERAELEHDAAVNERWE